MATYSNLGIKLITTGDESGTWGTSTNNNFSDVIDEAIAGVVTYNIGTDADFTLTVSDATSSDARHAVIKFTSTTLSATRTCTFAPDDLQKVWIVINSTTGGQSLTFKQGSAGATVTVANGQSAIIYSDGAGASAGAITRVLDSFTATAISTGTLTASTPVGVASGGTGQSSFTDGQLLIGNTTGNTLSKATLTAGSGISITNGSGAITIAASGSYGDVTGPASSTDNALARFDSTTGKIIQNSNATLTDNGALTVDQGAVINESGADSDTRIEGDTDTNLVFVDASTDRVGVGTNTPSVKLDVNGSIKDGAGNVRAVPLSGSEKTASYTLATTDIGEYIQIGTGGDIVIPDATFAAGDIISMFNNTTGNITITCSITTAYIAGTDSDKATMTLATRGVATVLFISSTVCVVTGNVS